MFFFIKKIIQPFLMPSGFTFILLFVGTILILRRKNKIGKYFLILGLIFYYLFSITPVSNFLLKNLENRYHPLQKYDISVNTIVVLTGGRRNSFSDLPITNKLGNGSVFRLLEAIRLYYLLNKPKIIISGGSGNPFLPNLQTAKIMAELTMVLGIPKNKLFWEIKSRDTYESAKEIKKLVGNKAFILVTSAYHMPRAMFIFKKLGMYPIPAPADYLGQDKKYSFFDFIPHPLELWKSDLAFHEYLGIIWYVLLDIK